MKEQTLERKFIESIATEKDDVKLIQQCVQIAKDYAEQEAIEFAEWMHENTVKDAKFYTVILDVVRYNQTLTECYQIFKTKENER